MQTKTATKSQKKNQASNKSSAAGASPSTAGTTTQTPLTAAALVMTPPAVTVPPVPATYTPINLNAYRGNSPFAIQISALPGAITELEGMTDYPSTFGPGAPPLAQLLAGLTAAEGWCTLRQDTQSWEQFVQQGTVLTWRAVMQMLDQLETIFIAVSKQNPSLAQEYPGLARLLEARHVSAQKAVATRRRKAAKATKGASATKAPATPSKQ